MKKNASRKTPRIVPYGTIMGDFLLAFFFKKVDSRAALLEGITGQITVLIIHFMKVFGLIELSYLMYNLIGCSIVVLLGLLITGKLK